jgi:hypothetical protein
VSYIPTRDKIFITSNRDEKNLRKTALPPCVYETGNRKLIYPRDADAGGSWIALHENGNAAVLLNGAFKSHDPNPPYRLSRGRIFLEIIGAEKPLTNFHRLSLAQIEPFTVVLYEAEKLLECRWDGTDKYMTELNPAMPAIWSSVTLYDEDVIRKRRRWFLAFMDRQPHPTQKDILDFHHFTGDGDQANDLVMKREELYSTVSITSVLLTTDRGSMKYFDLKNGGRSEKKIEFRPALHVI